MKEKGGCVKDKGVGEAYPYCRYIVTRHMTKVKLLYTNPNSIAAPRSA